MENKKEIVLHKIPLKVLIDVLTDVWNKGADYVDLIGVPDTVQDNIGIAVREEYFSKEENNELDIDVELEEEDDDENKPLKDEDFDLLM